ncbi:MAG: DUF2182 domain-containing protein [Gammaproteobacteria bacterium]
MKRAPLSLATVRQGAAGAALLAISAVSWVFLIASERAMAAMSGTGLIDRLMLAMMQPSAMLPYLAATALMWLVMMVAMMVPAVLPMVMVYRGIYRGVDRGLATASFVSGYFAAWGAFALLAALGQWWLHAQGLLYGMRLAASAQVAAVLFVVAGLYQLSPFKEACLARCRSPLGFFMADWRDGLRGAFAMGARHGLYCIGCCWLLMVLMFAGGAMSVLVMAALAALIVAERLLPGGPWPARVPGVALIVLGTVTWWQA